MDRWMDRRKKEGGREEVRGEGKKGGRKKGSKGEKQAKERDGMKENLGRC